MLSTILCGQRWQIEEIAMDESSEKKESPYRTIIWDYIDALNVQMNIVPLSYQFMSAQLLAESNKARNYSKKYGEFYTQDGKEKMRMPIEHGIAFSQLLRNLNNTLLAFNMIGVNAVIGMVSKYDGYLGALTKQLFADKPELLNTSEKTFTAKDILSYDGFTELKDILSEREVETLLRKNHVEQLKYLEAKLSIPLTSFALFPDFVEIMERRNLFVHSNGLTSRQYIIECSKNGVTLPTNTKAGEKLDADFEYVKASYKVLFQVGIMLGFVSWHKLRPDESETMINSLSEVAYDLINQGDYELALDIIDFALSNKSWSQKINHEQRLIFTVNKALCFHLRDKQDDCIKIINTMDVSAAAPRFHLAVAILKHNYDDAYRLMDKVEKDDEMKVNYKTWPLFKKIRHEQSFIDKFKEIFQEEYECDDPSLSNFEEVIKTAKEMIEKAKETTNS